MIRIGKDLLQKRKIVQEWLKEHPETDRIFCFYGEEQPDLNFPGLETIYVDWSETEMYRTFYPLLGTPYQGRDIPAITKDSLLIVDEMLMTKKRSDLKYNCTHHFLQVSEHHIVFNWLPIIDEQNDFMILLDYDKPNRYKGRSISDALYMAEDIEMTPRAPEISVQQVSITDKEREKYEKKKESLFDNLGQKDPATIPRNLALLAGDFKKKIVEPGPVFAARNSRFKKENVYVYKDVPEADEVVLLDMNQYFTHFNRFVRQTEARYLVYVSTGLGVDNYYWQELQRWKEEMEHIYACSNLSE